MSDDRDWIKAKDAAHLLFQSGSPMAVNRRMIDPLKYGRIEGRALDGTLEHRRTGHREVVKDWIVPARVWSDRWDQSSMILFEGSYSTRDYASGYAHVKLSGLAFDRAQFLEYFDIDASPPPPARAQPCSEATEADSKDKGGAPLDSEKWSNFAAVAVMIQHHAGPVHKGMKKAQVYKMIADYADSMDLEIPSDRTVSNALDRMKWLSGLKHGADGQPAFDDDGRPLEAESEAT